MPTRASAKKIKVASPRRRWVTEDVNLKSEALDSFRVIRRRIVSILDEMGGVELIS